jgi:hypothetical protein
MLAEWFGAQPLGSLTILDHTGQPFEDDELLVRPMRAVDHATLAPVLAHSLTHAWIRSSRPWIDEGLAVFAGLLWTERSQGRAAALDEMQESGPGAGAGRTRGAFVCGGLDVEFAGYCAGDCERGG